ncbi:MAG: di-trans,poly-cis-decaprenylcistransferase [Synergistaceae bacterium]|jgi:undecaprenyl diphosphate synthase|nr:di-trans,poly-cis-decaprenylcistransferase [Synergistaceae bacterium]
MPEGDGNFPRHVAIIMDGNGRWARKRNLPRLLGHRKGAKVLEQTVRDAEDAGIRYLSVYGFSTENWSRSNIEVSGLMRIIEHYLKKEVRELKAKHGRLRIAGRRDRLPSSLVRALEEAEEDTRNETGIQVVICLDYGGRQEIVDACKKLTADGIEPDGITEELLSRYMYLPDVPEPDLIIRTSGELRLSNFWLWTGAYSEFYFTDTLWPDFNKDVLDAALESYAKRQRRKGGV